MVVADAKMSSEFRLRAAPTLLQCGNNMRDLHWSQIGTFSVPVKLSKVAR